jgi:hypothetical protein
MTNQPNIKRQVLDTVIINNAHDREDEICLYTFARRNGYEEHRVAKASNKLYPAVNHGVSTMCPWPWEKEAALEWYDKWNVDPPNSIDLVEWVDE